MPQLAIGTKAYFAATVGAAINMTALSNAAAAVATLAPGHGVVVGDYLIVTSGWGDIDGQVFRVSNVATNDVTLLGCNTVSTALFPAGGGVGSVQKLSSWTEVLDLTLDFASEGGQQEFIELAYLSRIQKSRQPTTRTPVSYSMKYYWDESKAWVGTARTLAKTRTLTGVRLDFPNGNKTVGAATLSISETPEFNNLVLQGSFGADFAAVPTSYAT